MAPTKQGLECILRRQPKDNLIRYTRWTLLSILCGLLAGIAASIFLITLSWATNFRDKNQIIIWALPIAGFLIGWIYHRFGKDINGGYNLILDEIHDPKKVVPIHMAPLILIGTVITHLFGGSAGREGTAVQMGASLSDQLTHFFKIEQDERKILLAAGAGAGFGAAIGAPWAGVIFGMEVIAVGRLRLFAWFECLIASFTGYFTSIYLGAPHIHYPTFEIPPIDLRTFFFVGVAGIAFGLTAKAFTSLTRAIERFNSKLINYPPLKPLIAGVVLVVLFYLEGTYRYVGLGLPFIQDALREPATFREPILKSIFTAITVGSGFKGGEFIPLVFIGTTLGSALAIILPVSFQLLAALGFAAVFGGAANTPIACTLMAMEIFGPRIGPYAVVACFMSYYFSGHHGIYASQKIHMKKHEKLRWWLGWFGELPKRFWNGNGERK
jgi:H+/Cl- antiporter ClcA